MDATLAFTIFLLGIFSILEFLKTNQKSSLLKYVMLILLIWITISSFLDYLDFTGNYSPYYYKDVTFFFGTGLLINLFYLLVLKKIPRIIIIIEAIFIFFFFVFFINGFQFPLIVNKQFQSSQTLYNKVFYLFFLLFVISTFIFVFIKIYDKKINKNLYEIKINKWVSRFLLAIFILILLDILYFVLFTNEFITFYNPTNYSISISKFYFILFILCRPNFLDDGKYSKPFNQIITENKWINIQSFEYLFYSNHYYLRQEANLEDFLQKLNVTKEELTNFLKYEIGVHFTELLNKSRVEYLKELLKAKKYESFTIEALSQMAGFNNRRTMYYAFKKYIDMTPTEFIQKIK